MKYSESLVCLLGALSTTLAAPSNIGQKRQEQCGSLVTRLSWNDATDSEKLAYLDAAVCLTKQPSKLGHTGTSLHDDYAWVHNQITRDIHGVAAFLPWHRLFVQAYENALQSECGYTGHAMYWDWVRDSHAPASASVWDSVTGFGGNGTSFDDSQFSFCVRDGPFADLQLAYWNNDTIPHCLQRQFMQGYPDFGQPEMIGNAYNQEMIDGINLYQTFLDFHGRLEGTPHGAVHAGISGGNGDMGPMTSPNDPIFYLHHTQVDRLWWLWQQESEDRIFDYAGNRDPDQFDALDATLEDTLELLGLAPDRTVREFMDAGNAELCYGY